MKYLCILHIYRYIHLYVFEANAPLYASPVLLRVALTDSLCLSVSLSVSLTLCLSLCLSLSVSLCLSISLSLSLSLYLSLALPLSLWLFPLSPLCLAVCISYCDISSSNNACLCLSVCLLSVSLCFRYWLILISGATRLPIGR